MSGDLLIVNSGSSSIKFAVFGRAADSESSEGMDALSLRYRGHFSGLGGDRPRIRLLAASNALDIIRRHLCDLPVEGEEAYGS